MASLLSQHKTVLAYSTSLVACTIGIFVWLQANFVSKTTLEQLTKKHEQLEQQLKDSHLALEVNVNQLRLEIKQARTDELWFKKKLLLAKGSSNLTEYDTTVIQLIDAELQLYTPSTN